jgi:SAM-dependent methyltransferase
MSFEWHGIDRMRKGPFFALAGNASVRVRRESYEWLRERVGGFAGKIVLDHGATPDTTSPDSNCHIPWLLEDGAIVYATSAEKIDHLATVFPGLHVVAWPPEEHFVQPVDLVISNSVIAHVGDRAAQLDFVARLLRLGRWVYLTTPNRRHWLEFHTKLPLLHWLDDERYHALLRRVGMEFRTHLHLLTHDDVQQLFGCAAARNGVHIATQWYEPRLFGIVSNLVVLAAPSEEQRLATASAQRASVFWRYVLGRDIDARSVELYARAEHALGYDGDDAIVRFAVERPWSLWPFDTALAVVRPDALLRRRLLLMTAVLEARPEYSAEFLPDTT